MVFGVLVESGHERRAVKINRHSTRLQQLEYIYIQLIFCQDAEGGVSNIPRSFRVVLDALGSWKTFINLEAWSWFEAPTVCQRLVSAYAIWQPNRLQEDCNAKK